jgi:hypothetical protein
MFNFSKQGPLEKADKASGSVDADTGNAASTSDLSQSGQEVEPETTEDNPSFQSQKLSILSNSMSQEPEVKTEPLNRGSGDAADAHHAESLQSASSQAEGSEGAEARHMPPMTSGYKTSDRPPSSFEQAWANLPKFPYFYPSQPSNVVTASSENLKASSPFLQQSMGSSVRDANGSGFPLPQQASFQHSAWNSQQLPPSQACSKPFNYPSDQPSFHPAMFSSPSFPQKMFQQPMFSQNPQIPMAAASSTVENLYQDVYSGP